MYRVTSLNPASAPAFASLTYPLFRSRLQALDREKSWVAVGAQDGDRSIGLVLAELQSQDRAIVQSIYVEPTYRGQGVGTTLLQHLEQAIRHRQCRELALAYRTGKPTSICLEQLLQKQGWTTPQAQARIYQSTIAIMVQSPWWYNYQLPTAFTLFPFAQLTWVDYEKIQQQQTIAPWYSTDLDPFTADSPVEPLNSFGVRYQDEVVGWMVTHRITPDTIRYSSLVLRPDLQKMGRAIALVGAAIRQQLQAGSPENFLCTVQCTNQAMLRFAERRLAPLATAIRESKTTWKIL